MWENSRIEKIEGRVRKMEERMILTNQKIKNKMLGEMNTTSETYVTIEIFQQMCNKNPSKREKKERGRKKTF